MESPAELAIPRDKSRYASSLRVLQKWGVMPSIKEVARGEFPPPGPYRVCGFFRGDIATTLSGTPRFWELFITTPCPCQAEFLLISTFQKSSCIHRASQRMVGDKFSRARAHARSLKIFPEKTKAHPNARFPCGKLSGVRHGASLVHLPRTDVKRGLGFSGVFSRARRGQILVSWAPLGE